MNSKQIRIKVGILVVAFTTFYFYLKFTNFSGLFQYCALAVFTTVIAYCIFAVRLKLFLRITISIVIIILGFLLPLFLNKERESQDQVIASKNGRTKLVGHWVTDTIGGYSIGMEIQKDFVNLSQSNLEASKNFGLRVNDDFLELINEHTNQYYSWRFEFKENDNILLLKSKRDTLLFRKNLH